MKKGWQSTFLHQLSPPECPHKKDSYPLPRIQEVLESLVGSGHLSCLDLKIQILADKDGRGVKAVHCLYSR